MKEVSERTCCSLENCIFFSVADDDGYHPIVRINKQLWSR